jgi:hypothetical protein
MKTKLLLTLALLLSAVTGAWADGSWTSGGCDVTLVGGTLTVSKSSSGDGAMENYTSSNNQPWKDSRNNITSVVIGDGVTSIGNYAFRVCSYLTSVTIGSNVGSIGTSAFDTCSRLASVSIPASVTSIGDYAFVSCGTSAAALVVTIADGSLLSSIGVQAFFNANLASFNIPASVTNIGSNAFYNCSNLSSVVIHATSVPTCGNDAFGNYKSGRKIFVPAASVGSYGSGWSAYAADIIGYNGTCGATGHESDVVYALTGESPNRTLYISGTGAMKDMKDNDKPWSDFTTVIIGDGVTHIGKQSFDYKSFTSLTIGNGVKSIGELAFHNCSGLTSIVIPNSVETIGEKAFEYITTLTSLTIGSGVTSMADNAFDYCENVTSLTISDGVTTIGKGAFETYSSLTSVVIPSSVTSIGENAFNKCPQLSSVVIRSPSLTTYGSQAFDENKDGRNIFVPAANLNAYRTGWTTYANDIIGYNGTCGATGNESNLIWALDGESSNCTLYIGGTGAMKDYLYDQLSEREWHGSVGSIKSIVIGEGVTSIGNYSFRECTNLTSATIPNSVTSIGNSSFSGCNYLTSVTLNSNPQIQPNAFPGTATVTMNLTANPVGDDKWMTFFNDGYHFKAGENTTVYKGTLSGSSIVLKPVEDKIVTAGTAVILKSTGNPVMTLNSAASSDTNSNSLQGVSNVNGLQSDGTIYVLNKGTSGVGFYKLKSGKTLGYGKAYLDTSTTGAPSYLNFEENETTEVREVKEVNGVIEVNDNSWYTLDGRKMDSKPTAKGLYIVNGKKVVIK